MKTWAPKSEFPAIFGWSETLENFGSKYCKHYKKDIEQIFLHIHLINKMLYNSVLYTTAATYNVDIIKLSQ
jgi:hypothetical protein